MADSKRMMSSVVMEYPRFVKMKALPKLLYNYMLLYTDEYGVCPDIEKALLYSGAKRKDLETLIENGYVMDLKDDIYLIKHFPMFNSFRKDRMKPCRFGDKMASVTINENKVYTWNDGQMSDNCQTTDRQVTTKCPPNIREDKIREVNIREDKINNLSNIESVDELKSFLRGGQ